MGERYIHTDIHQRHHIYAFYFAVRRCVRVALCTLPFATYAQAADDDDDDDADMLS